MTKDNWIKAFDEILSDCSEEIGVGPKKEAKLKSLVSQVEKDAINRLNHDHEILVNTILETKKREIEDAIEKTNKRWRGKFDDIKADGVTRLECGCEVMKVTLCDKHAGFIPLSDLLEDTYKGEVGDLWEVGLPKDHPIFEDKK